MNLDAYCHTAPVIVMILPQYNMPFYLQYLATWPEYFLVKEAPDGTSMGYSKYIRV